MTQHIVEHQQLALAEANLQAVTRIEAWLDRSIDVYQTIGVEPVLSSDKYRRLVDRAHERGFDVRMIFVALRTVEEQLERIRVRVAEGGHDVPEEEVRSRRRRSFEQLAWFARHVDQLFIFDNSDVKPALAAARHSGGSVRWLAAASPGLRDEILAAGLDRDDTPLLWLNLQKDPR